MNGNFIGVLRWTANAGIDLSANQNKALKMNSAGDVLAITAKTDTVVGVQTNVAALSQEVAIESRGIELMVCGGAVTAGAKVEITATGTIINATTGATVVGTALETGVNTSIVSVSVNV